ncbi:threonine synthase [Campylobacterota bacterium]|nr:threonine synthase [Campylobacterota bacterium]
MQLFPTRGGEPVDFERAVLSPLTSDGGLYAPVDFPPLDLDALGSLCYADLARAVIARLGAQIDDEALETYKNFDDPTNPAPLVTLSDSVSVCELWHGPTRAFKDMALQPFGVILSSLAKKRGERCLILTATSGDTGPATLRSFANREGIEVVCIYPKGGTSDVQELQMISQTAPNLAVIAIDGNFDDAQNAIKSLLSSDDFADKARARGRLLSAANSVNFARILLQIIYHVSSYLTLLARKEIAAGEAIDIIVPSGNFGNALGAYYARKMGVPIAKIIIASNANNVLTDLIITGRYDLRRRELVKTSSPAMDILKSSNVERIIFDLFGAARTKTLFESLSSDGFFALEADETERLHEIFDAAWSNANEVKYAITANFDKDYTIDPHTATCFKAIKLGSSRKKIICSTAEWTKFAPTLAEAISGRELSDRDALEAVGKPVPAAISDLFARDHTAPAPIKPSAIEGAILEFLDRRG